MPASTYRHSGKHIPVATASAALTGGTLTWQEGFFGIVITGVAIGKPTELDITGVHNIAVPASTVKGDALWSSAALSTDLATITMTRTRATGLTLIGKALSDRDAAGNALVLLSAQPQDAATA